MFDPIRERSMSDGRQIAVDVITKSANDLITYAELDQCVEHLANWWRRHALRSQDRVLLASHRDLNAVLQTWAIVRAGAVVCPIDPRIGKRQIESTARLVGARAIVRSGSDSFWTMPPVTRSHLTTPIDCQLSVQWRPLNAIEPLQSDYLLSTLLFSSGSTGCPKAIAHRLSSHLASAAGASANMPLGTGDRWLLNLPTFHVSGLSILMRCALAGATVVLTDTKNWLAHLQPMRISHLSAVPTQMIAVVEAERPSPSTLRGLLLGGSAIPRSLCERLEALQWPVAITYGMTEMASQVATTLPARGLSSLDHGAPVLPGRELQVAADGEILVRGEPLMAGYVAENAVRLPSNEQGWFATGDLGNLDSQGRVRVTGRRDNLFISGGENIYPEEIERLLIDCPGIRRAVVVACRDRRFGHRPVAIVQSQRWDESAWRRSLSCYLPSFKIPDAFLPWPADLGRSFKPSRSELARWAEQSRD